MITKSEVNLRIILTVIGFLLIFEGAFMLLGLPFALYYKDGSWFALLVSGLFTAVLGLVVRLTTKDKNRRTINRREGYIITAISWVIISFFGTLPFMISGEIPSFTRAFFETMSGFTTTGATTLTDIESVSHGILFWRSVTHWIGGMGIIVLSVAILPFLGIGGMQLYAAEMPGVTKDKLHPRITSTAKRLWGIYVLLTLAEIILLMFGGMNFFDSICHAFGTIATGGFSTKNDSITGFTPFIQYVIIFFMILAGTNFTLHYLILVGRIKDVFKNEEYRKYLVLILGATVGITALMALSYNGPFEEAFRNTFFQVVSIITTTGYVTSDYLVWPMDLWFIIFILMFAGGMAGSTGGGMKILRHILLFKNSSKELRRAIHPKAIIPVRLNREAVPQEIIFKVMAFFVVYMTIFALGAVVMSFLGLDFDSAIGASIATLGNIGPGLGAVGPVENYSAIPNSGLWFLSLLMLMGRLELFTILIFLSSAFWRK